MNDQLKEDIEDIVQVSSSAIDFLLNITESSLSPILEYTIGAVPLVKDIYSIYKRRQFDRKLNNVINMLKARQDRIENMLKTNESKIEFGDEFVKYLDIILFHEPEDKKIKYYIELLISSYERKKHFTRKDHYLNLLINLSEEEVLTILSAKNYVIKKLKIDHMVDIWALNEIKRKQTKNSFYDVIEEEGWFIKGQKEMSYNRNSALQRLISFGLIIPRYGYYGDELEIARYILDYEAFYFCDFIETYYGKREDSFLMISGERRSYKSKYGKGVKVM